MTKTRVIKIDPLDPDVELLGEAADLLKKGKLVIIPTETVYGIAANTMNKETQERLFKIKQRQAGKPFAVLVESKIRIEEFSGFIPIVVYKLIDKFWPGPLTVILKHKNNGTIGLRMPDHEVALKIIDLARVPLACPSANLAGKAPPRSVKEALVDLDGLVDLAIDAGECLLGVESTVVDLTTDQPGIVRQGAIKKEEIEAAAAKKTVLFICTGNSCRSVMAEAYLKKLLKEKGRSDVEVYSAGTMSMTQNMGATQATIDVLRAEGMDVSGHRSKAVNKVLVKKSDLILVMEKRHEARILELAPEAKNRLFLLKEFAKIRDNDLDIDDPIGTSDEFYGRTLNTIKDAVRKVSELI